MSAVHLVLVASCLMLETERLSLIYIKVHVCRLAIIMSQRWKTDSKNAKKNTQFPRPP